MKGVHRVNEYTDYIVMVRAVQLDIKTLRNKEIRCDEALPYH